MKYKIFFNNVEVAEFNKMDDAINYVNDQIKNDNKLNVNMFECYMKL